MYTKEISAEKVELNVIVSITIKDCQITSHITPVNLKTSA